MMIIIDATELQQALRDAYDLGYTNARADVERGTSEHSWTDLAAVLNK